MRPRGSNLSLLLVLTFDFILLDANPTASTAPQRAAWLDAALDRELILDVGVVLLRGEPTADLRFAPNLDLSITPKCTKTYHSLIRRF